MSALPQVHFLPPTLRQCLWLTLPALLMGALLRISYMVAIPEAFVTADTSSYTTTGFALWENGEWEISKKRRWWYPFWIAAAPLLPGTIAQSVAAVQHFAGLAAVGAIGWIVGQLTHLWRVWIPIATLLAAVWPPMLIFEHIFLAESMFITAFVFTAALSLPVDRLKDPDRLFRFLIALTLTVGLRPSGRAVWLGAVALLALVARDWTAWRWKNITAAIFCTATTFTAGSDNMGSRLLLSSILPLVDTERASYQEYRQALKPLILRARETGHDYPWWQADYKTRINNPEDPLTGEAWKRLIKDDEKFGRVCKALAVETVLAHPLTFVRYSLVKFLAAAATPAPVRAEISAPWEMEPSGFWEVQAKENETRWQKKGERMKWIYGGIDWPEWAGMASERRARTSWYGPFAGHLERLFPWAILRPRGEMVGEVSVSWLGWLALLGFLGCLRPKLLGPSMMLWLPMLLYLGLTFGVGDRVERFTVPVHWCWICYCILALDIIAQAGIRLWGNRSEQPFMAPDETSGHA